MAQFIALLFLNYDSNGHNLGPLCSINCALEIININLISIEVVDNYGLCGSLFIRVVPRLFALMIPLFVNRIRV